LEAARYTMAVAQVQIVCKALSDANLFGFSGASSTSARDMIAAALPHATGEHGYQKEMRSAASTVLESARDAAEAEIRARREEGEAASHAISDAQKALGEASASTQQAQLRLEEAAAALEAQAAKAAAAKQEEQRAKREEATTQESKEVVLKRKAAVDSSLTSVQAGEDGELEEDFKTDDTLSILQEAGCEKTLLKAFPTAVSLPKAKRGRFDAMTLEEVKSVLSDHGAMLQAQLDEAQTLAHDSWAEALGCEALMEVEEERREAASRAVQEAEAVTEAKKAAEASDLKLVATRETERSNILVMQTLAEEKLSKAQQALAALEQVQDVEMPEAPRDAICEKLADVLKAEVPHSPKLGA